MFKAKNKMLPSNIQKFFCIAKKHSYFTRSNKHFQSKFARTAVKSKCASIVGVTYWNKLTDEFRNCVRQSLFVKKLKLHILESYKSEDCLNLL